MVQMPPILSVTCDTLHNRWRIPRLHDGAIAPESVTALEITLLPDLCMPISVCVSR
jgi:hypothetical protein